MAATFQPRMRETSSILWAFRLKWRTKACFQVYNHTSAQRFIWHNSWINVIFAEFISEDLRSQQVRSTYKLQVISKINLKPAFDLNSASELNLLQTRSKAYNLFRSTLKILVIRSFRVNFKNCLICRKLKNT